MDVWNQIFDFLRDQGPAILALLYAYMNGRVIRANHALEMRDLQDQIKAAHDKIDQAYAGKSSSDVVGSVADGPGAPKT